MIATSAIGPITWVNESALLEKSGSPVFELIVAVSVAICPSVPAATVAVIVICSGVPFVGASVASVQTTIPPAPPGSVQENPAAGERSWR